MSATERLRELLDERGVEWSSPSGLNSRFADSITFIGNGAVVSEIDGSDLLRINFDGTPEQAVEATLGRGTCRSVCNSVSEFACSECGFRCDLTSWISLFDSDDGRHRHHHHGMPSYCPNCGRKVVGE